MKPRLWACSLLLILTALPAVAGGEKGDFELGIYGGFAFLDDYETSTANLRPEDALLYGVRAGYFFTPKWSAEISAQQIGTETKFDPVPPVPGSDVDADITSVRLNFLFNFRPDRRFRPFVTAGLGLEGTDIDQIMKQGDPGYNLGGGLRWFVGEHFGVRLDARWVSTDVSMPVTDRQDNVETSVGLLWAFGGGPPADSDGDGVKDRRDDCPDTPRGALVDNRGCPMDGDGDGVADGIDRCPDTGPGILVDATGCPKDSDGDGVFDGLDACPGTPRGASVDARGCPADSDGDSVFDGLDDCPDTPRGASVDARGCPADSDGDGVFDGLDDCPDTPRGASVDARGCPEDSDGDGVPDGLDQCPGTPAGTKVDAKGCQVLFEDERRTLVLEGVQFELNRDRLTPEARSILDRVGESLVQWPEIRVEVGGHTDSSGKDAYNLELSERRAIAVRDYLIREGVADYRIAAKGYGESQPMADNTTAAGRAMNRRVELKKVN